MQQELLELVSALSGDMQDALILALKEVKRAQEKFPMWPIDPIHCAAIVAEEAGELVQASFQFTYDGADYLDMKNEAVQTAAAALRFLTCREFVIRPEQYQNT